MLNSRSLPPLPPAVSISQCFPPLPAGPEAHVEVRQIHVIVHVGFFEKRVDMALGDKPAQHRYNAQENSIMLFTVNQAKQPLKLLGVPASWENLRKCIRAKYLYEADSYKLEYLQRMYRQNKKPARCTTTERASTPKRNFTILSRIGIMNATLQPNADGRR